MVRGRPAVLRRFWTRALRDHTQHDNGRRHHGAVVGDGCGDGCCSPRAAIHWPHRYKVFWFLRIGGIFDEKKKTPSDRLIAGRVNEGEKNPGTAAQKKKREETKKKKTASRKNHRPRDSNRVPNGQRSRRQCHHVACNYVADYRAINNGYYDDDVGARRVCVVRSTRAGYARRTAASIYAVATCPRRGVL